MAEPPAYMPRVSWPGVRTAIRTTDTADAVERIRAVAEHRAHLRVLDPATAAFDVRTATFGPCGADRIRIDGIRYRGTASSSPLLLTGVMSRGRGRLRGRDLDIQLVAGDAFLGPTNVDYDAEYDNPAFAVIRLSLPYVSATAERMIGIPAARFRFQSHVAVSPAAAGRWSRTVEFVTTELAGRPDDAPPELVVTQLFHLVATTSLSTFANTAMTADYLPGAGHVAPASLRRAVAYIEAYAGEPISAADIAENAGVGPRALQEAFRRYLGTTPTAYLRRVRLDRAHRDLQVADPTSGVTVRAVARRWGFAHHGRFTAQYRAAYGRPPSLTLRS